MVTIALRSPVEPWHARSGTSGPAIASPGPSHALTFDLVTDLGAFETLEPEWDALFGTAGRPTQVFQTFAWNWHWCRHYLDRSPKSRAQLAIVTGRLQGRLVLVWPLVLERVAGLRRLAWMGDPVSQYGDVLVAPEADDDAILLAAWAFALRTTRADLAHLRKVRDDSMAARVLDRPGARIIATEQAPYLDLSGISGTEACQQLLASKGRRNRRRHERRLADQGPITVFSPADGEEAGRLAQHAIDLKREALAGKGQISRAFADDRLKAFFADVAAGHDRQVPCRIAALRSGSDTAAIQITLDCKGHRFLHVTVYACGFEKFGAGALLLEREVQTSFENGLTAFDLLAPMHPYKMEFANSTVAVRDYAVAGSLRGRLYAAIALSGRQHAKTCIESLPAPLRRYLASLMAIRAALKSGAGPS